MACEKKIAAIDEEGGMGLANTLPWYLPADLAHFKAMTMGKPIVMGRKTYESIGRPLVGRRNIVLSRQSFDVAGVEVANSLEAMLALFSDNSTSVIMVIGGVAVFEAALDKAESIYLTRIHHAFKADVFFPVLDTNEWEEALLSRFHADAANPYDLSFYCYSRKNKQIVIDRH